MGRKGRPPAWTSEEREHVLALADEGIAQRVIAETVFGDRRYHGRVERILRALPQRAMPEDVAPPSRRGESVSDISATMGEPPDLRQLLAGMVVRQWRDLAASGSLPSLNPLEADLESRGFGSNPTP